ncbi:MAG: GNAT family N-acetyltransferase [Pedococcus sp.]
MTSTDVRVLRVDAEDPAQDDVFRAWADVYEDASRDALGEAHSSWSREERRELLRSTERRRLAWAAVVGDAVVGAATLAMPLHDNLDTADVDLAVSPGHRRAGIGSRLLATAEAEAVRAGRSVITAETQWGMARQDDGGAFAASHGYAAAQTVRRNTLSLPADRDRLQADLAGDGTDGYRMRTCWDGIPQEWLEGRAELGRRMSTDVPLGDLRLEEEVWDADRVRSTYAQIAAMGRRVVDTFAVHGVTGELVGYTQVQVDRNGLAYQQDTLVIRGHRGHGLGLRLKAACTLAVMDELPGVGGIRTWNADDNLPMLAVNREIGYVQDAWLREWQKVL